MGQIPTEATGHKLTHALLLTRCGHPHTRAKTLVDKAKVVVVIARVRSSVWSLLHQCRDLHHLTYLYLSEDQEPTSHYLWGLEISLLLRRWRKFHLDPLTSHSMLRHTPKDYFYNHPITEQCLAVPMCTIMRMWRNHLRNEGFISQDHIGGFSMKQECTNTMHKNTIPWYLSWIVVITVWVPCIKFTKDELKNSASKDRI
jgi:hypothetical protein